MTAVSVYDAVSISRDTVQPVWLLISATTGTLLSGWHPEPSWSTGLALAWYMPWIIIASMVL